LNLRALSTSPTERYLTRIGVNFSVILLSHRKEETKLNDLRLAYDCHTVSIAVHRDGAFQENCVHRLYESAVFMKWPLEVLLSAFEHCMEFALYKSLLLLLLLFENLVY